MVRLTVWLNGNRRFERSNAPAEEGRCGFTLIALLVSISIIALLMSLILPTVNNAREAARRIECANRARNLALAAMNFATARNRLPAAGYWGVEPNPDKSNRGPHHNWVVDVLAYLDRKDLAERWDSEQLTTYPSNAELANTHVSVLVCPSDISTAGCGDLSFAVNGGIGDSYFYNGVDDCVADPFYQPLDLNGNGIVCASAESADGSPTDRVLFFRLGSYFSENWKFAGTPGYQGTIRDHTPATIIDGMSNTILLGENCRTGVDGSRPQTNWSSADGRQTRIFFSHQICEDNSCSNAAVDFQKSNFGDHAINSGRIMPEGESPFLNSFHPGGADVAFADGRVQSLSESIDGRVYYNLFTPQGTRLIGTPLDAGVTGDDY